MEQSSVCFSPEEKTELLTTVRQNEKDLITVKASYKAVVIMVGAFLAVFGVYIQTSIQEFKDTVSLAKRLEIEDNFQDTAIEDILEEFRTFDIPDNTARVDTLREEQIEQNILLGRLAQSNSDILSSLGDLTQRVSILEKGN